MFLQNYTALLLCAVGLDHLHGNFAASYSLLHFYLCLTVMSVVSLVVFYSYIQCTEHVQTHTQTALIIHYISLKGSVFTLDFSYQGVGHLDINMNVQMSIMLGSKRLYII